MALNDLKLTNADFSGKLITELPNAPSESGIGATQLKARFDASMMQVLLPRFNALIDMLKAYGAALVDAQAIDGVTGSTLQEQLENLKTQLDGVSTGSIPDGSLTDAKLSREAGMVLDRLANHTHTEAQVEGLVGALAGKAEAVHTHSIANVANLQTTLDNKAPQVHAHAIADVEGLQTSLNSKSATNHTHTTLAALKVTGNVGTGTTGVVNVYIGNGNPPAASSVPNGTLFIKYE